MYVKQSDIMIEKINSSSFYEASWIYNVNTGIAYYRRCIMVREHNIDDHWGFLRDALRLEADVYLQVWKK